MTPPSLSALLEFNKMGLIPGPEEEQKEFIERAAYCIQLKSRMIAKMPQDIPFGLEDLGSEEVFEEAAKRTRERFDIVPAWLPVFFSNEQLTPWHGGCAWTFQETENSPVGSLLQLRKQFRNQRTYLGLYDRGELMAHEMAHAGRMMFREPKFEEILAYQTSGSGFRRYFGPIVQSPGESMFFVIILMMIFLVDVSLLTLGAGIEYYQTALWLKLIPLGMILFALVRLWNRQRIFHKCLAHLKEALGDSSKAGAVIFRLTDREICLFAAMPSSSVLEAMRERSNDSWRWKVICGAYGQCG
jgi:hypothetical protein